MAILIDTNVISDVLFEDPNWLQWSIARLMEYEGHLQISPVIYAELCYPAEPSEEIDIILDKLSLTYVETPRQRLYLAAQAYKIDRSRGGTKTAPLPDFLMVDMQPH
ncbi:MAG: DNA-binding protein [Opitutae bacterium]|nr:DNA-binding protein [Opitutae bacterium]